MDVAVAILHYKHFNSIDKTASIETRPDTSDFEILLEESYGPTGSGGSFVPSDDADIFRATSSCFSGNDGPGDHNLSIRSNADRYNNTTRYGTKQGHGISIPSTIQSPINRGPVKLTQRLPRKAITFDQEPSEIAAVHACNLFAKSRSNDTNNNNVKLFRRAVPVALWKSEPSSPYSPDGQSGPEPGSQIASGLSAALFCVPVLEKEKIECRCSSSDFQCQNAKPESFSPQHCTCRYRFHSMEKVLSMCRNASAVIDPETRHLILRLDEWLKVRLNQHSTFLWCLFVRPAASVRLGWCVHNPGHKEEISSCHRQSKRPHPSNRRISSDHRAEIAEDVRSANTALACMMAIEKCDRLVMNPLFGSGMPYRISSNLSGQQLQPNQYQYIAKNRPEPALLRRSPLASGSQLNGDGSDSGSYLDQFPLHRATQVGQAPVIKQLLNQHYDVNQLDPDHWAPIHYASWYGHLAAVQVLLNYGQNCTVNIRNKNGSTPVHFAAWCGHQYVVELLLSHPDIDPDLKDKDGKTALNLCECVPKPEWQAIADLLRSSQKKKRQEMVPKVQVDLMDGSNAMLALVEGEETNADQLHKQMCQELQLTEECGKLFSIWICSESLQLQLKGDHKPMRHLQKWKTKLWQWSDIADSMEYDEKAHLVFRRDARISLRDEKEVKLTDTALALLFHEAHQNFLRGLYPCGDHDVLMLAATVMHIIHGDYDSKRDKLFLSNEKSLAKLLPVHKHRDKSVNWVHQIMSEHKHILSSRTQNSLPNLQYRYLSFCEKFRSYGSTFFTALMFVDKPVKGALYVHAGVNDAGLHLINCETKMLYRSFEYTNLSYTFQPDKPFIKLKGKENGVVHEFTLKTKQANMIKTLLTRFTDHKGQLATSNSPSLSSERNSTSSNVSSSSPSVRR